MMRSSTILYIIIISYSFVIPYLMAIHGELEFIIDYHIVISKSPYHHHNTTTKNPSHCSIAATRVYSCHTNTQYAAHVSTTGLPVAGIETKVRSYGLAFVQMCI